MPNDLVALIATGGSTASLQQFTNDRQRILSAIDRIGSQGRLERKSDLRFRLTASEAARINAGDDDVLEMAARRAASQSSANETTQGSLTLGAEPPRRPGDGAPYLVDDFETLAGDKWLVDLCVLQPRNPVSGERLWDTSWHPNASSGWLVCSHLIRFVLPQPARTSLPSTGISPLLVLRLACPGIF